MIITNTEKGILLRWREGGEREEEIISFNDFKPHFFVEKDSRLVKLDGETVYIKEKYENRNTTAFRMDLSYEQGNFKSLEGKELVKVTWSPCHSKYTKKVKSYFHNRGDRTYEADVQYHYRYAVDMLDTIPEYNLRKWYWDMEWMQGGEHDGAITAIVVYDNYDDEYHTLTWQPDSDETEKTTLEKFLILLFEKDPDMLISWFGWKFDLPKLIERLHANDLDPRLLSPVMEVDGVKWSINASAIEVKTNRVENYSPIAQPIKGRICVPLDLAFERQWNDAQRGTLPSLSLDYVSESVLGEKKLVSSKFPDKNEFFRRGWQEDTETYLEYAVKDVELIKRIDDENHTTEAIISLQRLLIAPFDACFYASNMGGIYFMRNASWKAPTGRKGDRVDYDGAMVYDPLSEATNGLHLGVAAFDFAGLYPSMMIARNISWETKSDTPTEFGVNIRTPKDFSVVDNYEMKYYKTDKLGLLPKAVLELKNLRNEYKVKMKESESKSEYVKWNNNQLAVKRLMASFYGIVAYQGFGWADVDLAASITASAREAIRTAAFKVREL